MNLSPSNQRGITVCGASDEVGSDGCPTHEEVIDYSAFRRVRCCSDWNVGEAWEQRGSCSIWAATKNTGGGNTDNGNIGCSGPLNFFDAVAYCKDAGERLCTSDELANDCAKETGCGYDEEMIWSSTTVRFDIFECNDVSLPSSVLFTI